MKLDLSKLKNKRKPLDSISLPDQRGPLYITDYSTFRSHAHGDEYELLVDKNSSGNPEDNKASHSNFSNLGSEVKLQASLFLNLAIPSILVNVAGQLQWFFSSSFAGRYFGADALGALSLAQLGNLAGKSVVLGLLSAFDTLAGKAFGAKQYEEVGLLTQRSVFLCGGICVLTAVMFFYLEPFFTLVDQPPKAIALASGFLKGYALVFPVDCLVEIIKGFYRCQNICMPFTYIILFCTGLHYVFLDYLVPSVGFIGVIEAHILTQYSILLMCLIYIIVFKQHKKETWNGWNLSKSLQSSKIINFLALGVPGIFAMSEWWFWECQTILVGTLGPAALAAHSIAYNVVPIVFHIPYGVALACQTRVATLLAEKNWVMARKVAFTSILMNCISGLMSFSLCLLGKKVILRMFMNEDDEDVDEVEYQIDRIWFIVSIFLCLDALLAASMGIFRGASMHGQLGTIVFFCLWVFGIPLEWYLGFHTYLAFEGLWLGLWIIYFCMDSTLISISYFKNWSATVKPMHSQR